ncbi:hypothetical protein Hanom_Chr06g00496641 [Helianthus anomalus]
MPLSSLRFGQFYHFRLKVCFFTSGSKRFEILPFSREKTNLWTKVAKLAKPQERNGILLQIKNNSEKYNR